MAMRLHSYHGAIRTRPHQCGRVLSLHRRALNLLLADGEVICLVAPELGNGPMTLVVEAGWPLAWAVGSPVRISPDGFRGPESLLPWDGGNRWDPLPLREPPLPPDGMADLRRELAHRCPDGGALPVVLEAPAHSEVQEQLGALLRRGIRALAAARWEEAVERLVGLGPGLTPSGDDLLAGYLLTRQAFGGAGSLARSLAEVPESQTTPLGRHILRWAARGVAGEKHLDWLASFLAGRPDPVEPLLAVGATSGADWLAGVLLALQHVRKEMDDDTQTLRPVDSHRGGDPGLALL